MTYDFPENFFDPPAQRTAKWPDHPDVRAAVNWFKSFMSDGEWKERRLAAATRLYDMALQHVPAGDKGRLFNEADTFGWYLFLAEAFIDHVQNYDPTSGSRVVPVFSALGRNLPLLTAIPGVEDRVSRLLGADRSNPNGALFELLVAACYARQGGAVSFVPELPGRAKTHDFDVQINGVEYAVECKRMEVGEYSERERQRMRELWAPCVDALEAEKRNTLGAVTFVQPLQEVPSHYLFEKIIGWEESGQPNFIWCDEFGYGHVADFDISTLQAELESSLVLQNSSRLMEIIAGEYVRNRSYIQCLGVTVSENPRYIDTCNLVIVLRWSSVSDAAINAKARDVLRKLAEANRQLPDGRRSIVHIGFEAVEGDEVERARYRKILETTERFDPEKKHLEYVYCHWLAPESPPDQAWAFDETVHCQAIRPEGPRPLANMFLVLPDGASGRVGGHWEPE